MASLRDHMEMQSPDGNDRVAGEQQEQQPARGWRFRAESPQVKILAMVITVALLALAATVAVLATGGSPSDTSSGFQEEQEYSPAALESARLLMEHQEMTVNSPHHSVKDRTSEDFEQVMEPLEHVRGHSHSPSSYVSHKEKEPVQPAVGYELVEEPVERVKEHDYRERHHSRKSSDAVQTEDKPDSHSEKRYSTRLASSKNAKGIPVCETPECAIEAAALVEAMDLSVDPCEDFFTFACGGYIDKHPIEDNGAIGTFSEAAHTLDKRLHLILEQPAKPDAPAPLHMTKDFYHACMDTDTIEAVGLETLLVHLNEEGLGGWAMTMDNWDVDSFQLETALANLRRMNIHAIYALGVDANILNTSEYIIYGNAGNVPLDYRIMAELPAETLAEYREYMLANAQQIRDYIGSSISDEEMAVQVDEVILFELKFSKMLKNDIEQITDSLYFTNVSSLQSSTDLGTPGAFSWLSFLRVMFTGTDVMIGDDERIISFDGPFWQDVSNLMAEVGPRALANFIGWYWVIELGQETTYAMRNLTREFQTLLTGEEQPSERSIHCMMQTNHDLGFALARDYIDEFFPGSAKKETEELVELIRSAFQSLLDENTWMIPEDLAFAREKLMSIDPFVAYPDWIMDDQLLTDGYEGLHIESGTHLDNLYNIGKWLDFWNLASLRDTPEHSFLMPPTIVNAFYNPQENTITILAGILQSPFYAHNSLAAVNYGGIGMVIGHEMTHGFDNTGRLFDKDGNLEQWWSDETIISFNKRAQCFRNQYDKFIPPELIAVGLNQSVDGRRTLGENIADNGGIREAYRAYQLYVERYGEEPRLPGLDEFTPDHLFYLGFSQSWCEHKSPAALLLQMAIDPHSPGRFRILGPLSNDKEFSRVWNCPADSYMNRGNDSCVLW